MSRIFLSHSSKNDFEAVAIGNWLHVNGWDDVFLDLDPAQGIHPGERWERALHEHATRCEAVLFLVSHDWLVSDWCRREYELTRKLNKRIFVILIDDTPISALPPFLTETLQAVSLAAGEDHQVFRITRPGTQQERHVSFSREGLARLKAGLTQAGLDPRFFVWPPSNEPNRAPYRGLEPLEAVDAGIFFGRDAPVIEALDALRGLREGAAPRLFVILGASGAGKSSFLRAGLLPRLARDDRNFLTLSAIRPERATITGVNGLVATLTATFAALGMTVTRADLREAAERGAAALRIHLKELVAKAQAASSGPTQPTLVIAIDQAEELFRAESAREAESLLTMLHALASADDPAIIAVFVIRSDSYDALQHAKALDGLAQKAFPLLPMPRGSYRTVIEGPIARATQAGRNFEIDPSLTEALLGDLEKGGGSDALPLLALTLEQLFSDHEAARRLTRHDYENFDGLKGAIDAAVARAFAEADKDARLPKDHDARLTLLRRGLIPWLAGIDPQTKTPRRRRAPQAQIPQEARPLVDLLVEQRLLSRTVDDATGAITLEPAHEALLRQWGSLKGWLEEDFARLVTLEGVQRAARDWDANARDPAWATHAGNRLEEAARLDTRPDLAAMLDAADRSYLAACREKENEARDRKLALAAAERRAAQRTRIGLAASSVLAVLAIGAAVFGFWQAKVATEQRAEAVQQKALVEQQNKIVEQQKSDLEEQKSAALQAKGEAEQQTKKAEQRSAVLAANVSQSFTEEGALDQALLLMLDAAHAFDDKSVPDEILIALTKALDKRQNVETRTLFPNMSVFKTDDGLLLFDPATKDIWKLTDSVEPKRLVQGSSDDAVIFKLKQSADGKDYVVVRENFDVERIDPASGARKKVGAFSEPKPIAGQSYSLDETKITDDGLVVRDFSIALSDPSKTTDANYYQILDSATGRVLEGEATGISSILLRNPDGGVFADMDGKIVQVKAGKDGLVVQKIKLSDQDTLRMRFGDCIAKAPQSVRKLIITDLTDQYYLFFSCVKLPRGYLIEKIGPTSSGKERMDALYRLNGTKIDIRDTLNQAISSNRSENNFAWVGMFPTTEAESAQLKQDYLVILQNRTVYLLRHELDDNDSSDGTENWSVVLQERHPTFLSAERFLGPHRLLVTETDSGRLVIHDFAEQPHEKLFASPLDNFIGTDDPVDTLHQGTCAGYTIKQAKGTQMPDGRQIIWDTSTDTTEDKHVIVIPAANDMAIPFGDDATCIEFSADWSRMLVVRDSGIGVYDFHGVQRTGKLAGNEITVIPAASGPGDSIAGDMPKPTSAFFVGATSDGVLVTDSSNRVLLWKQAEQSKSWTSSEVYKGDNEIVYAEPDATGNRLILIEYLGSGGVHGFLYSVSARETWLDLGSEYKRLGATFTKDGEVAVAHFTKWTQFFPLPPLSALVQTADKELSPECRPPTPGDYRHSPCWPASYQ